MRDIYRSTMGRGVQLLNRPKDLGRLHVLARRHQLQLDRLLIAANSNDIIQASRITQGILRSFAARLSAVIRTTPPPIDAPLLALSTLEARAATLNLHDRMDEAVRQIAVPMLGGDARLVLDFGPDRRAGQALCADILDARLPQFDFDFLCRGRGADAAMLSLQSMIEKEGYDHVVTIDIRKCFGSANQEKVVTLLPLPHQVTRHVLLVQEGVTVKPPAAWNAEMFGLPLSIAEPFLIEADTAARQGLPQGSSTSTLIMSRAVLGPLLDATGFAHRLVLYGDDVTVCAKGLEEARDTLKALRSALENSPAGPLTIGRHHVGPTSQVVHVVKYGFQQMPEHYGGGIRIRPCRRSYKNFAERAQLKYLDGGAATGKGRVSKYRKAWTKAFPLWKPTRESRGLLWQTAFEARATAERQRS